MSRDPRLFLQDILESAAKALAYTKGMSQEEFETNDMAYDAVMRNLEIIGEAAKQIPKELRAGAPAVPWRMIFAGDEMDLGDMASGINCYPPNVYKKF